MGKMKRIKNTKLRRRVRRTMGTICLITALLVAAIPVPKALAADADVTLTWDNQVGITKTSVPVVPTDCEEIYTTGDGTYQFAFVPASSTSPNKVAVILGYESRNLVNNSLTIPDTVDAYTKYSENQGTYTGYVAVSKTQKPLFYKVVETGIDVSGNEYIISENYYPCYYANYSVWQNTELSDFYYKDAAGKYVQTVNDDQQWIKNISVAYIGNQSLKANTLTTSEGASQEWVIAEASGTLNTTPSNGIFANNSNIVNLTVGANLLGIGNYAFYGCTNLETVNLGNGLKEVGKSAFANCVNMNSIGLDFTSNLQFIADNTFLNCRGLTNFILPSSVTAIYDRAFEGCTGLKTVDISGSSASRNVTLNQLGSYVFRNCTALSSLIIPVSIDANTVQLNNFAGCSALQSIKVQNQYTNFAETTNYSVDQFKTDVLSSFYFEAADVSGTHTFTKANAIAFKYSDADKYEIIQRVESTDGGTAEITYQVNSSNQLLYFNLSAPVADVVIPATIGPYGISAINSGSFSGNCFLEKITIPGTVTAINENAFRGCHNLKHVIFQNAATITYIGAGAFSTQVVDVHSTGCTNQDFLTSNLSPTLTFTGTVGDNIVPYTYAMTASSNINAGQQTLSYITYYSGWPTNLEIKYDKDTGKATLVDYPTYTELSSGAKYNQTAYPYITAEYETAARDAITKYNAWLTNPATEVTDYQWQIINAALNVSVPTGVHALTTGLFSGITQDTDSTDPNAVKAVTGQAVDERIQSITLADIDEIEPYTFSGCDELTNITITGGAEQIDDYGFANAYLTPSTETGTESALTTISMSNGGGTIGDYAFCNNGALVNVNLSAAISEIGLRPFKDCEKLKDVTFSGGPYFTTENSIIFGTSNGTKSSIIQCLESRGNSSGSGTIAATELAGVSTMVAEAFMDCSGLGSVDLSSSSITQIPAKGFYNTKNMYSVTLPTAARSISKEAFAESTVRYLDIPSSVTYIDPSAFNTEVNPNKAGTYNTITFYCETGSAAETFAQEYESIITTDKPITTTFKVIFWDYDETILSSQDVLIGTDAVPPTDPVREGYKFEGWLPSYKAISRDTDIVAQYTKIDSEDTKYTVEFIDYNDKVLYTQKVASGEDAITPQSPSREGYTFTGWRPAITNITADVKTYAQYDKNVSNNGDGSGSGSGSGSGNDASGGNGSTTNPKLYTLTVVNGSGSGSYVAGTSVIIIANNPATGMTFSKWTSESTLAVASSAVAATVLTMPSANATITANYEKSSTTGGGSANNNNNGGNTVSGGNVTPKPGTTVVIDKNGLSNTGVVSATVNGSSDNFVIKITESNTATEEVLRALIKEYGSVDNIKYFPMDISLYDSTGNNKITDTTGLSISITLPLPDSLVDYAGNNKVAGVVSGELDKISPKFSTIDKVPCITFKAEHFSPYVIYVDTTDLSAPGTTDDSPKTGDIHPKWFLVIGLTCVAIVLFMKKDRRYKKAGVA